MTRHPQLLVVAICGATLLFTRAVSAQTPKPSAVRLMKAIVYRDFGSSDVLRLEEVEKPIPDENQVLVRVRAASVNPLDWHYMEGTPYIARLIEFGLLSPKVTRLGVDYAGIVEAVGGNVTQFRPGDEVFGAKTGALAEYVCVRADRAVVLKPSNITVEQAAAVPIAALTALQGLRDKGKVQPGQRVLINGASGGVGTFAVQIAKSFGAHVTGVCSARNVELVRSLGADQVIDYTKEDFTKGGQRYDVIIDNVGNRAISECIRALTPKGKYVLIGGGGLNDHRWIGPLVGFVKVLALSPFVSQDMGMMLADLNKQDLTTLCELMQAGKVTPVIDRHYTLSEAPEAIRYMEEGHAHGKVVLTVGDKIDPLSVSPSLASGNVSRIGPTLIALSLILMLVGVSIAPIVFALVLNRKFQRANPGMRPYRWGYYFSIQSLMFGIGLGLMLESGVGAVIICGAIYAILAWFFARRHRWAWITLTIASVNPIMWIINAVYLRERWAECSVATPRI
jgi:NADPH:quinone reductase-like Zn-dependent oxidoreductase